MITGVLYFLYHPKSHWKDYVFASGNKRGTVRLPSLPLWTREGEELGSELIGSNRRRGPWAPQNKAKDLAFPKVIPHTPPFLPDLYPCALPRWRLWGFPWMTWGGFFILPTWRVLIRGVLILAARGDVFLAFQVRILDFPTEALLCMVRFYGTYTVWVWKTPWNFLAT